MNPRLLSLLLLPSVPGTVAAQLGVAYTSSAILPETATDQHGASFSIDGLSGVTWIGGTTFASIMDNSDKLVLFELELEIDGSLGAISEVRGVTLARSGDHEGVAAGPAGVVLVANESAMTLREFDLASGALLRTLGLPEVFQSRRGNLGLESLSLDPEFGWCANEEALEVDGPRATPEQGTTVRLLRERTKHDRDLGQIAYLVEPVHGPRFPFGNPGQSGLCDLVALPDGSLLALERSFALADPIFLTRIFLVEFEGATDISALEALDGAAYEPAGKRLLYEGGHQNLEGLALGPRLAPATHALIGVVDDGDPVSVGAVVAFRLDGVHACAADVNGDGLTDVEDLHDLHLRPQDINGDGTADGMDLDCLGAYVRRHERWR